MTSQFFLIVSISLLTCVAFLSFQRHQNSTLRAELDEKTAAPTATESKVRANRNLKTSSSRKRSAAGEKVQASAKKILEILQTQPPTSDAQSAMLRALPHFLTAVENLDSSEIRQLLEALEILFKKNKTIPDEMIGLINITLEGFAAELNPRSFLDLKEGDFHFSNRQLTAFSSLIRSDPQAAIDWVSQTQLTGENKKTMQEELIRQLLLQNSDKAIIAIRKFGLPEFGDHLNGLAFVPQIPNEQIPLLWEKIQEEENADIRPQVGAAIVGSTLIKDISAAREMAEKLDLEIEILLPIFKQSASTKFADPSLLIEWMASYPGKTNSALSHAAMTWGNNDLEAAANWINSLENSPKRDLAIRGYARAASHLDTPAALEWAAQISNPKLRDDSIKPLINSWKKTHPAAAESWLKEHAQSE